MCEGLCFASFLCFFVLIKVLIGRLSLETFLVLFLLMSLLVVLFCSSMARVNKTTKPIDGSDVADSASDAVVSFEFSLSRVTSSDLDEYTKASWFAQDLARPSEGEVVLDPHDVEIIVYKELFLAGLRFPPHHLIVGVLKRFNVKFHQLNPSSFVKLSIYVWSCKSQGVELDLEGFILLYRVHPQPQKITVEGKTVQLQFGVYAFIYRHGAKVPVQAQKNKWASPWMENWFYIKLDGKVGVCGKLTRLDSVTVDGIMTDGCVAAVDALRILSCHQCALDLVEEFFCTKVLPLRANQAWFVVNDDERYRECGLKGLGVNGK